MVAGDGGNYKLKNQEIMARRKPFQHPQPPMMHGDKFEKYLPCSKRREKRKAIQGTHCGFRLVNQLPLYRIDNNQNVEL